MVVSLPRRFHVFPRFLRIDLDRPRTYLPTLLQPSSVVRCLRSTQYSVAQVVSVTNKPERERDGDSTGDMIKFLHGQVVFCNFPDRSVPYRVDDVVWVPDPDRLQVLDVNSRDWQPLYALFGELSPALPLLAHYPATSAQKVEPVVWSERRERARVMIPSEVAFFSGVRDDVCQYGA